MEDGTEYHELRGVMLECEVHVERETERVAEYGLALIDRYESGSPLARETFREQAKKRIGMRFTPTRVVSWDHPSLAKASINRDVMSRNPIGTAGRMSRGGNP